MWHSYAVRCFVSKHSYYLETYHNDAWVQHPWTVGLEYGRGYIAHRRESPGPRLAMRLVRDDGRVMDDAPGLADASIGIVAGWPTEAQYRAAARRADAAADEVARVRAREVGDANG